MSILILRQNGLSKIHQQILGLFYLMEHKIYIDRIVLNLLTATDVINPENCLMAVNLQILLHYSHQPSVLKQLKITFLRIKSHNHNKSHFGWENKWINTAKESFIYLWNVLLWHLLCFYFSLTLKNSWKYVHVSFLHFINCT